MVLIIIKTSNFGVRLCSHSAFTAAPRVGGKGL
jgi:hypothetical protein